MATPKTRGRKPSKIVKVKFHDLSRLGKLHHPGDHVLIDGTMNRASVARSSKKFKESLAKIGRAEKRVKKVKVEAVKKVKAAKVKATKSVKKVVETETKKVEKAKRIMSDAQKMAMKAGRERAMEARRAAKAQPAMDLLI
jgi:hypothetical protein